MLPDPVTVAASAPTPALVMRVIKSDGYGTERLSDDGIYGIVTTHDRTKNGERHYLKITETKDAVNPYTGGTSKQIASVSVSLSYPAFGWTAAQKAALYKALADYIVDTEVTIANIINFQS